MKEITIAAQLYTLRDFLKTPEDLAVTFSKVKKMGYNAIQVSGIGPIDFGFVKEIADKEDLKICVTHIGFDRLKNDMAGVINQHKLWDCKYVGIGSMPDEYRVDRASLTRFAKEASEYGKVLLDNDLQLIYHNHNFEFKKFDGITGMDILFEESDTKAFNFEIDTYWVQAGGANPVDLINKMKGRMNIVHFKDMVIGKDNQMEMAEIGEGNLNFKDIIKACNDIGVDWCPIEQDVCQRDPFESLKISHDNLLKLGCKF